MNASKKPNKKTNKKSKIYSGKKLFYAFVLLLTANIIVFAFFAYFISKLGVAENNYIPKREIKTVAIPEIEGENNPNPTVSATSYMVYDPLTRTEVMSKNPDLRLSPASSIKILTALVALDEYDLQEYLTVEETVSFYESRMGLFLGEEITVENLLYGLLLVSGGDAAKTLANSYPGGEEAFVHAMNEKAKNIGLSESKFLDTSGYQDGNYSTAFELALLGSHAMKNDVIREIVGTRNYVAQDRYGFGVHPLTNLNELLVNRNVTGVKTGFTNEAGGVLITSYLHKGRELIIVVMKSEDRFADTRSIMEYINNNVVYSELESLD